MKKQLSVFRVLTFVLVPFAGLFAMMSVFSLLVALANPAALISGFMMVAFVIYTFTSLAFLTRGIDAGRPLKASLRDWIRVNAFVSAFMAGLSILEMVIFALMDDAVLRDYINKSLEGQSNLPPMVNTAFFLTVIKIIVGFMAVLSVILLTHIVLNFRLMKAYRHLFQQP
ncbi:MAG: hypothetical protein JO301_04070 [Chitinophagaceae bacterium]|nr:hypothetical protein [Chitinophagaceae bacterium]